MKTTLWNRLRRVVLGLAIGATPLVTSATCDPANAAFGFFRDDDDGYYYDDGYVVDEIIYYDDCYYYDCY